MNKQLVLSFLLAVFCLPSSLAADVSDQARSDTLVNIPLDITTHLGDQQVFRRGDKISFLITLKMDAYLYVVYQDAHKNNYLIIPNEKLQNHFYKAGFFVQVPEKDAAYNFTIQPPFGNESIWVFASDQPTKKFSGESLDNGLLKLRLTLSQLREKIKVHADKAFGEANLQITTQP